MPIVRLILCVFCLFFRYEFRCYFFLHNFGKMTSDRWMKKPKKGRDWKRQKSEGRFIVLLIQLSNSLFTHLTYNQKFRVFLILFTSILTFTSFIVLYLLILSGNGSIWNWYWIYLKCCSSMMTNWLGDVWLAMTSGLINRFVLLLWSI